MKRWFAALARSLQAVVSRPIADPAHARAVDRDQRSHLPPIDSPPDETSELAREFREVIEPDAEPGVATKAGQASERLAAPRLDGVRVLVVDDNPDAVEVLGLALERAGAIVRSAPGGFEAVSAWEEQPSDVLLCDLAMPGMDGFEVLRRIRAIDASGHVVPALAVTAYASEDYRARCLQAGFTGHFAKPYNIADIVRAVAAAVSKI